MIMRYLLLLLVLIIFNSCTVHKHYPTQVIVKSVKCQCPFSEDYYWGDHIILLDPEQEIEIDTNLFKFIIK